MIRRGAAAVCALVLTSAAGPVRAQDDAPDDEEDDLEELSLEELMEVPVTTASNVGEKLAEAPASVIVVTREELEERGYRQLADIFDDLPGMDVARPYGDNWVLVYWRGFRGDVSAPFLLMIDGVPANSLHYIDADVPLTALPLTSIDRVEIVQGPASSVYGPNAFMGMINVITVNDAEEDGMQQWARLGVGTEHARFGDATVLYKDGPLRFRMSARFETGVLDDAHQDLYEFSQDRYYNDRDLWGGFVDNPGLAGFHSRHAAQALDAHLFHGDTELAARFLDFASGYGVEYVGDRALNNATWKRYEIDTYLRHKQALSARLESRTLLRYRQGGIDNSSFFVDGYTDATAGRVAAFSYWQYHNASWSAYQDVAMSAIDGWSFIAGLKLEQKDLQKAYDIVGESASGTPGGYEPVGTITADGYAYPEPPPHEREPQNRIYTEDVGAYLQLKKVVTEDHHLHLGGRVDRNSGYDLAPTVRAGYVGRLPGGLGLKALYGQAFQEPPPRVLYGGWTGSGSDPELKPQRSQTFELDASLQLEDLWQGLALYAVHSSDTIVVGAAPRNVGKQLVVGLDWSFRARVAVPRLQRLELWGSYTRVFHAEEELTTDAGGVDVITVGPIGDQSKDKVHLGASIVYDAHLSGTLRARWYGAKETTPSNPIREIDGYATADVAVTYRDVLDSALGVSLSINNITDAAYVHPGINDASGGDDPSGSAGFFASAMPQPGRTFLLSLTLRP